MLQFFLRLLHLIQVLNKRLLNLPSGEDDLDHGERAEVLHRTQPAPPHPVEAQELANDRPVQGLVPHHDPVGLGTPLHHALVVDPNWDHLVLLRLVLGVFQLERCDDGGAVAGLGQDHHLQVDCVPREDGLGAGVDDGLDVN